MPRKPRIDLPGYHNIVNRGVNRTNIFSDPDDELKGQVLNPKYNILLLL